MSTKTSAPTQTAADQAVSKFLEYTHASTAAYFDACVHCGECAEACHFYLSTKNPIYTPIYKLQPMLKAYKRHKAPLSSIKRLFGLVPEQITKQELEEWSPLVYDSCNMCGRCTLACPMGIDIAFTIRKMREGFVAADIVPGDLRQSEKNALETGSPMRVQAKALQAQVRAQEKDCGIAIELDKKGADYLVILSSMEIMGYPEVIGSLAKIFKEAGIDWTISTKAYEATNVGIQIGSWDTARTLVQRVVDEAEHLGVKYVISPECGHAYSALRWQGPNLIGRSYDFEVIHIIELLHQLTTEGRLQMKSKNGRRLTLHDPCQIVRRGGLVKEPRALLNDVADHFEEMQGAGITNFCCGGGGGVSANSRAAKLQASAFECKMQQFNDIDGLELIVTPCANCRTVLEDGLEEHDSPLEVIGLSELLAQHLDHRQT